MSKFTKGSFDIYHSPTVALYSTTKCGVFIMDMLLFPKQNGVKQIRIGHLNSFISNFILMGIFLLFIYVSISSATSPLKLICA